MPDDQTSFDDTPIINTEKLEELFSFYKFPLILAAVGVIFLIATVVLLTKNKAATSDVVFTSESSSSAKNKIKIDIEGAVISAGVYEMEEGSRIADVLTLAGGLSASADREWVAKNLNRAARLSDGAKIYIPTEDELSSEKSVSSLSLSTAAAGNIAGSTSKTVNLNTASQAELEALPGIGPVTAGKIITGRPYQTVEELKTRKIISNSLYDKLKDTFTIY